MMQHLFEQALGIQAPWYVKSIDFDSESRRLDIEVDFKCGSFFQDETEGDDAPAYKVHDTVVKEWRHLNFFEHECYLKARVPRIKQDDGKVRLIAPPWSGVASGLTLLFEPCCCSFVKPCLCIMYRNW